MEWVAGEKTKVVGTYPPRKRGWTGYVEKDTAGQTNIYSVEVSVYDTHSRVCMGRRIVELTLSFQVSSINVFGLGSMLHVENPTRVVKDDYLGDTVATQFNITFRF